MYWDRVWLEDKLIEETRDYVAQDRQGNVWYFGEDVNNYEEGKLIDHKGSWQAGQGGAKPGIWIKANPRVGESYRQEYLKDQADDMSTVVAVDATVTVKSEVYNNCVKTYDWTTLDDLAREYKYYCPGIGGHWCCLNIWLQGSGRSW